MLFVTWYQTLDLNTRALHRITIRAKDIINIESEHNSVSGETRAVKIYYNYGKGVEHLHVHIGIDDKDVAQILHDTIMKCMYKSDICGEFIMWNGMGYHDVLESAKVLG